MAKLSFLSFPSTLPSLLRISLLFILSSVVLTGCESTYYSAMEKVGIHKRDLMVSRVEDARESQEGARQQFVSALEQFSYELGFSGGDLEEKYHKLNESYEESVERAELVRKHIDKVESVSEALFDEWRDELEQYRSASLRRSSEKKLRDTRRRYKRLVKAMYAAEERMEPVLAVFHDNVLFLKHNLNAMAIASLKGEVKNLERDVNLLVKDMEQAIAEADKFITTLKY